MDSSHNARVEVIPSRPGADDVELADYVWALWKYRVLIALVTLACGAIGFGVALVSDKVYQATAVVSAAPPGGGELPFAVISQVRNLLQSPAVVERAFAAHPEATTGLTPGTFISKNLSIERNRDTNLWMVTVRLPDPVAAAGTANLLSEEAVEAHARNVEELKPIVDVKVPKVDPRLIARVETSRQSVVRTRDALLRFRAESRLEERRINRDVASRLPLDLAVIEADLSAERAAVERVDAELRAQPQFLPIPGVSDDDVPPGTPPALRRILNPLHGTLSAAAAQGRARITSLERRAQMLRDRMTTAGRDGATVPALDLKLAELQTDYQRALDRTAALESQLEAAHEAVAEALAASPTPDAPVVVVSLAERATPPASPIAPRPVRSLLLGLALGAFVAVIAALVLDAVAARPRPVVEGVGAA